MPRVPRRGILAAHNRGSRKLTPAQKEAVLRSYHMHGSYSAVAKNLGLNYNTVRKIVLDCQLDPAYAHTRAQAFDEMAGKVNDITDQVISSIKPEELQTTYHKIYDACGNLMRVVPEGPGLKDKALAIAMLVDKTSVLQAARNKALDISSRNGSGPALLLPEDIEGMKEMLMQKVHRLRIVDVQFAGSEVGQHVSKLLTKVGVDEADYVDVGSAPFD